MIQQFLRRMISISLIAPWCVTDLRQFPKKKARHDAPSRNEAAQKMGIAAAPVEVFGAPRAKCLADETKRMVRLAIAPGPATRASAAAPGRVRSPLQPHLFRNARDSQSDNDPQFSFLPLLSA
jgi:hypothetical protein